MKRINKFKKGIQYVFDELACRKWHDKCGNKYYIYKCWWNGLDGKLVTVVNEYRGRVYISKNDYLIVSPQECRKVTTDNNIVNKIKNLFK